MIQPPFFQNENGRLPQSATYPFLAVHEADEIIRDKKDNILVFIILEADAYVVRIIPRMSDSSFADFSAAIFVVCRADKPRD